MQEIIITCAEVVLMTLGGVASGFALGIIIGCMYLGIRNRLYHG